jgi:hypothetical protein
MLGTIGFMINGTPFKAPNNDIKFTIEGITRDANRDATDGALHKMSLVNRLPTFQLIWEVLTAREMIQLCNLLGATILNHDEDVEGVFPQMIDARTITMRLILPQGIRTVEVYIGDKITATLSNTKIPSEVEVKFDNEPGDGKGNWLDYVIWKNIVVDVVGLGHKYRKSETGG